MKKIPDIIKLARRKLRDNQTEAEKTVWEYVRTKRLGVKFQRQFPLYIYTENSGIDRYIIPDFYCSEKKCIIEIDGNIHDRKDIYKLDKYKEKLLQKQGYNILRIENIEVISSGKSVVLKIKTFLDSLQPLALEKTSEKQSEATISKLKLCSEDSGESLQPSVFRMKERDSERDYEKSSQAISSTKNLQQKRFTMRNESFTCENCGKEITKHPSGSARNHCPYCLYSKHLDKDFPGDRASECLGKMKPIAKGYRKNKGWMVVHKCTLCDKKIPNKLAEDDNVEVFGKL